MIKEYHHWHSSRLGREMGIVVYGHWGPPMLTFPTSGGDEWELEHQSMIGALEDFVDAGRVKIFAAGSVNAESFYNKGAHPFHRSYVQSQPSGERRSFDGKPTSRDQSRNFSRVYASPCGNLQESYGLSAKIGT